MFKITRQNFTIAEMATSCSHTKLYTLQFTWLSSVQINLQHYGFLRAQILSVSAQKTFLTCVLLSIAYYQCKQSENNSQLFWPSNLNLLSITKYILSLHMVHLPKKKNLHGTYMNKSLFLNYTMFYLNQHVSVNSWG